MSDENTYFIDTRGENSSAELARLLLQDTFVSAQMPLLPPEFSPQRPFAVLDLACGPGGWVLDVAQRFPEAKIVGIDVNERIIAYAQAQTTIRKLANRVAFQKMSILEPLDFPDHSFAYVNARFIGGLMPNLHWPILFREVFRILQPGGLFRITEGDAGSMVGAPCLHLMREYIFSALFKRQQGFAEKESSIGPNIGPFMEQAGFRDITERAYVLNYSAHIPGRQALIEDFSMSFALLKPFITQSTDLTEDAYDRLREQVEAEMLAEDFRAIWYLLSVCGTKK